MAAGKRAPSGACWGRGLEPIGAVLDRMGAQFQLGKRQHQPPEGAGEAGVDEA